MRGQALLVILLIVGIMAAVLAAERFVPEKIQHSSMSREVEGTLAFYLLLEKYTVVSRVEAPLTILEPGTFLMIGPVQSLSPEEQEYLFTWVEQGNRLIIFSENPRIMQQFGSTLSRTQYTCAALAPLRDHWSTNQVRSIFLCHSQSINSDTGDPLFADEGNCVILEVKRGEGEIFLISDTSLVWNSTIDELDNEIFLVQLVFSERIYFDEYHLHSARKEKGVTWESFKAPFTSRYVSFFVQFILTFVLLVAAHGKRFGAPRTLIPREVQSSELVVSAAELYYRARKKEVLKVIDETQRVHKR